MRLPNTIIEKEGGNNNRQYHDQDHFNTWLGNLKNEKDKNILRFLLTVYEKINPDGACENTRNSAGRNAVKTGRPQTAKCFACTTGYMKTTKTKNKLQ